MILRQLYSAGQSTAMLMGVVGFLQPGFDSASPTLPPAPLVGMRRIAPIASGASQISQEAKSPAFWCAPELIIQGTDEHLCSRFDPIRGITEVFEGDFNNNRIVRHDFDSLLDHVEVLLATSYAIPWLAEDLDRDGQFELIVQTGDPGFGGNGYLDILQSPSWTLRKRFTFVNQKGWMHPRAVNLDADPYSELFFTLNDGFGGPCQAAIIDYAPDSGFYLKYRIPAPAGTGGPAAIGDPDEDGLTEFIIGAPEGYTLFEWKNDSLHMIGFIDSVYANNNAACYFSPRPDLIPRIIIGHGGGSASGEGFQYKILKAVGDNQFVTEKEILRLNSGGRSISATGDSDCDGLDEMVLELWPWYVEYEWDESVQDYVEKCSWNAVDSIAAALNSWYSIDLDRDGSTEWTATGGNRKIYAFGSPTCVGCDPSGACPIPPPCLCACHGDPRCDGTMSDVVDVVKTIGIAFRGELVPYDSDCPFERADFNCSGTTDVVDVVKVVDVAFRGADAGLSFCSPCP